MENFIVSTRDLASFLLLKEQRVSQLVHEGVIEKLDRNQFDLKDCVQKYTTHLKKRKEDRDESFTDAKTRKEIANATMAELELSMSQGRVVLVEDVGAVWNDVLANFKSKLSAMGSKVGPICAHEDNVSIVEQIIDDEVNEALNELSNYDPTTNRVGISRNDSSIDGQLETATKPKRGRVGRPRKALELGS